MPRGPVRPYTRQNKNSKNSVDLCINEGVRMEAHMRDRYGTEATADFMHRAAGAKVGARMPYRFYPTYCDEVIACKFTKGKREYLRRALQWYAKRKSCGAITKCAMRGSRKLGSCRDNGGKNNAKKSPEMTHFMLQYFVDFVQNLYVRADASLMMRHARRLRLILLQECCEEYELPKIIGNAGAQWFRRWRIECGIIYKTTGMQLKVPWSKILKRVKVLLGNIFRIRCFWEHCHPSKPMRFISLARSPPGLIMPDTRALWARRAAHSQGSRRTFAKPGKDILFSP